MTDSERHAQAGQGDPVLKKPPFALSGRLSYSTARRELAMTHETFERWVFVRLPPPSEGEASRMLQDATDLLAELESLEARGL